MRPIKEPEMIVRQASAIAVWPLPSQPVKYDLVRNLCCTGVQFARLSKVLQLVIHVGDGDCRARIAVCINPAAATQPAG